MFDRKIRSELVEGESVGDNLQGTEGGVAVVKRVAIVVVHQGTQRLEDGKVLGGTVIVRGGRRQLVEERNGVVLAGNTLVGSVQTVGGQKEGRDEHSDRFGVGIGIGETDGAEEALLIDLVGILQTISEKVGVVDGQAESVGRTASHDGDHEAVEQVLVEGHGLHMQETVHGDATQSLIVRVIMLPRRKQDRLEGAMMVEEQEMRACPRDEVLEAILLRDTCVEMQSSARERKILINSNHVREGLTGMLVNQGIDGSGGKDHRKGENERGKGKDAKVRSTKL